MVTACDFDTRLLVLYLTSTLSSLHSPWCLNNSIVFLRPVNCFASFSIVRGGFPTVFASGSFACKLQEDAKIISRHIRGMDKDPGLFFTIFFYRVLNLSNAFYLSREHF